MGDLGMEEDRPFVPSFAGPLNNPDPDSIRVEAWVVADDPTREVLNCIHPNLDSEEKRKDVIEFVQRLIGCSLGLQVFPYGSVPLKTYLPDGDIDLTVLSTPNLDETIPREVLRVLEEEEKYGNTEFTVKDTQFIDAEVKLVKCLVQDIVIDISFNQLGGLCTLCFLEQVDRLAGKDHLFKRSILLIKAWCYYESRILGAHHGLISTYALETLVLYIFHVFHASLNGPIEVLYRFLDYYAKFDWDNYCVSLDGPVRKSSLPDLAGENRDIQGNSGLLGAEFRKNCMDMFIVPSKGAETVLRAFNLKNLNIIDPLKENNNLGRSVHKGNYYRIRSAFRYGARRLGKILQLPYNNIGDEIKKFFKNTLQRHKPKYRRGSTLVFDANGFGNLSISSRSENFYEDDMYSKFSNGDCDDYMNDVSTVGSLKNDQNAPSYKGSSVDEKMGLEKLMERGVESELVDGDTICICTDNDNNESFSDNLSLDSIVESEFLNSFSDLTGDYDAHIRNLLCSQSCHGYALSTSIIRTSPPSSPYGNINTWDPDAHSWSQNPDSQVNANGALMGNHTYINGNHRTSSSVAVRGTGPYIPNMNCSSCKDRQPPAPATRGRGRGRGPPISNGHSQRARGGFGERNLVIEANHTSQTHLEWSPRQAHTNATLSHQTHLHPSQVNSTTNGHASQIQPEWSSNRAHVNATLSNHTHQNSSQVNSTAKGHASQIQPELTPKRAHTNATSSSQTHQNSSQVNSTTNGHASEIQPALSPKRAHANTTLSNQTHQNSSQVNSTTNGFASQIQPECSQKQAHVNPNMSNQTHQIPSQINSTTNGLVNQPRKLEFGSFRSMAESSSETGTSSPVVSSPKLDAFGTRQGRIGDNSFHLKNEDEFPPLSAS